VKAFHRWLGILLALPAIWIVATGLALGAVVYYEEKTIPYRVPEQLQNTRGPSRGLSAQERVERLITASGNLLSNVRGVVLSSDSGQSDRIEFKDGEIWFFAPQEDLAFAKAPHSQWKELLVSLHRGKFLASGAIGRAVFSGTALLIWILSASSLFFFRARNRLKTTRDVHSMSASWFTTFLLFIVGTGGFWNFSAEIRGWHPSTRPLAESRSLTAIENALALAQPEIPSQQIKSVYFIQDYLLVLFEDSSRVYFDLQGKEKPSVYRPFTIQGWVEPLYDWHTGRFLHRFMGQESILFPISAGAFLLVFVITGLQIAIKRKRLRATLQLKVYQPQNAGATHVAAPFHPTKQMGV